MGALWFDFDCFLALVYIPVELYTLFPWLNIMISGEARQKKGPSLILLKIQNEILLNVFYQQ